MIELAGSLGLSSRVTFHGNLPSAAPVLASSDIFVLASYADPCSLAVAEARYAGCAVIATAVGGTPELLGSGENGLLVNPGDPEGLAAAIMQVAADAGTLREWRRRSKAGADYLVVERVHRDYLAVYLKAKEMR
jgi:glycosyltransferase involved in cell wall biosynthesis